MLVHPSIPFLVEATTMPSPACAVLCTTTYRSCSSKLNAHENRRNIKITRNKVQNIRAGPCTSLLHIQKTLSSFSFFVFGIPSICSYQFTTIIHFKIYQETRLTIQSFKKIISTSPQTTAQNHLSDFELKSN